MCPPALPCRVYAYTTSPVQQSILRLFVRCDALLPNLFVGTLTRESVKSALEVGITAEQVRVEGRGCNTAAAAGFVVLGRRLGLPS